MYIVHIMKHPHVLEQKTLMQKVKHFYTKLAKRTILISKKCDIHLNSL